MMGVLPGVLLLMEPLSAAVNCLSLASATLDDPQLRSKRWHHKSRAPQKRLMLKLGVRGPGNVDALLPRRLAAAPPGSSGERGERRHCTARSIRLYSTVTERAL